VPVTAFTTPAVAGHVAAGERTLAPPMISMSRHRRPRVDQARTMVMFRCGASQRAIDLDLQAVGGRHHLRQRNCGPSPRMLYRMARAGTPSPTIFPFPVSTKRPVTLTTNVSGAPPCSVTLPIVEDDVPDAHDVQTSAPW
jgi:hypothetical protein